MKRFLRMAASAAFVLLLSACARHKIIPDDTLAQIFHDAFLTNAYIGSEGVKTDSLRIYEPIFARYGYTTDDVHYTIGNFSKRKSARLGDVVERAIEMLEREGKIYNQEVAVLDTIDNVARRTFTRTVLGPSELYARRRAGRIQPFAQIPRRFAGPQPAGAERLRVARTARQLAHQRLHRDPAAQPRGELLAPVYDRHDAPPPAHRLPDLQRQARAAFGDGHRPQGGVHSPDPHGRRKTLRTATRHPDFRR